MYWTSLPNEGASMFRLSPLALLVACVSDLQPVDMSQRLTLNSTGAVIEGEFVISHDLSNQEMDVLGIEQIDFNVAIGVGLYQAIDTVTLGALKRALDQRSRGDDFVEANRPIDSSATTNDPYRDYQWNFDLLNADKAWEYSTGSGITVAVLDTGVSFSGEDAPVKFLKGWDFADNDSNPNDLEGHGTHVAGTIAQATNNGRGVAGLAYGATILPVRVLGPGGGSTYDVANGITYAVDNGADVINMSLGSPYTTSVEDKAVQYAIDKGVIVVAASGNAGRSTIDYPAACNGVISVGAVGANSTVANYSNGGSGLDVVAPGGDMSYDRDGDGYADGILQETLGSYEFYEGTSMATPHVSALAALLLSAGATPDEVPGLITSTAKDLGSAGWNTWSGYGLIDPVAALEAVGTVPSPAPDEDRDVAPDTTAPVISGIGGERSGTSLTIWWDTDEPASSEIYFDGYGTFGDASVLVVDHELRFTIDSSESYEFEVISVDAAGNEGRSDTWVTRP